MNSDSFIVLRSDYATGHPFQTQALAGTTTIDQLFNVTNAQTASVQVWSQNAIVGSFTPGNPNDAQAVSLDQLGRGSESRAGQRPGFTSTSFAGRGFRVRAMGTVVQGAATTNAQTMTFYITQGQATNVTTRKLCAIVSATNVAAGTNPWIIEASCIWDPGSQTVFGEYWGVCAGSYASRATVTSVTTVTPYTSLQFSCAAVFATSNATSTATLVEFSMEAV